MEVFEAIRSRRSIRRYKQGADIPRRDVETLLEAAMMAPSAVNSRPWEFYATDREEIKRALMQAHPACKMLETASWAIVVCGRPDLQPRHGFWPQDCGAAIENMLLAARAMGYGTCWCGCYPSEPRTENVKAVLGARPCPWRSSPSGCRTNAPTRGAFTTLNGSGLSDGRTNTATNTDGRGRAERHARTFFDEIFRYKLTAKI